MNCSRTLFVKTAAGDKAVVVSIEDPVGRGLDWSCSYEIGWPSGVRRKKAHGVDAIQALNLALQRIGVDLYSSNEHADGLLRWRDQGAGYGFPVPKDLRPMLVGLDKEFEG